MQDDHKNQQDDILNNLGLSLEEGKILDNLLQDVYRGSYDIATLNQYFRRMLPRIAHPLSHKVSLV